MCEDAALYRCVICGMDSSREDGVRQAGPASILQLFSSKFSRSEESRSPREITTLLLPVYRPADIVH